MGKIPGNASFPIRIAIPVMEVIIYLVFEENGYTPENGVFNRPVFSLSCLGNYSGSLKLIGALTCKLKNEPKNDPLSAILMEQIKIIGPPLFGKNPSKKGNWLSQDPVIGFPWGLAHSVGKIDQKLKSKNIWGSPAKYGKKTHMFTSWVNSKRFLSLKQLRQLQPSVALETILAQGEMNILTNGLRNRVLHGQNTRKRLFPH